VREIGAPVLVMVGELDRVALPHWAKALSDDAGGELMVIPGAGHGPGRSPVPFNLGLRRFVESVSS
jgi:pimeloyl-ACP methyl ester carboxylesterase